MKAMWKVASLSILYVNEKEMEEIEEEEKEEMKKKSILKFCSGNDISLHC